LLEFLVSISLFSLIVFLSYHAFEEQKTMVNQMESRTRPEEESNYRMLVIKHFLEHTSQRLAVDPFLECADVFFPDLSFGSAPNKNAFSVAHISGEPVRFVRFGSDFLVPAGSPVEKKKTYLMAGCDITGNFAWNYYVCEQVSNGLNGLIVKLKPLQSAPPVMEKGTLIEAEIHGFLYQNQTLYWISPGGSLQPYFAQLDAFEYTWSTPTLTISWQKGAIKAEFRCLLH